MESFIWNDSVQATESCMTGERSSDLSACFWVSDTTLTVCCGFWLPLLKLLLTINHQMWSLVPCPGGQEPQ